MPISLFDFQEKCIPEISSLLKEHHEVLCVSPGGSGKTVIISAITQLKILKNPDKKVCIFVHREELANQTRDKIELEILYKEFLLKGLVSQLIDANTTYINQSVDVYVIMVETFNRRAESEDFLYNFRDTCLCFYDEAHRSDFNKIFPHFEGVDRLGFTATPIAATKKHPLKDFWKVMIEIAKISMLQELNQQFPNMGVVPSNLYNLGSIDRSKLSVKGNDFDEKKMSKDFSKMTQIDNTIAAYFDYGISMKTLCFDVDVDHSKKMSDAFKSNGVPSRHVNGNPSDKFGKKEWRRECLIWLKQTPNAVLNNVGILTTGFDEPSVESIIINSSMMSLSLYIQKMVRGSRPYRYSDLSYKKEYLALDMGNNAPESGGNFGDCNIDIDWQDFFDNPNKPNRTGIGGFKSCPECGKLNGVSSTFCNGLIKDWLSEEFTDCGYVFPITEQEEDIIPREMMKYFNSSIDIKKNVKYFIEMQGLTSGRVYHETLNQIANMAFTDMQFNCELNKIQLIFLTDLAVGKIKELGKILGKKTYKENVKLDMISKLRKIGFLVDEDLIVTKNTKLT